MSDTTVPNLSPEAIAAFAAMRHAIDEKVRRYRNWMVGILAGNFVIVLSALWKAFHHDLSDAAMAAARTEATQVAKDEAAKVLAVHSSYMREVFRSVQDRAAEALEDVGALGGSVDGVRKQMAEATLQIDAASRRTTALDEEVRSLETQRKILQDQLAAVTASSREYADGLGMMTRALAALRNSDTGQLAQHAQALAQVIEEHGSLADVQLLAGAVRTGTFAQLDCRGLIVRRADGSILAELRDDALTFRDRRSNEVCEMCIREDHVRISVGSDIDGPQCIIDSEGISFWQTKEKPENRVRGASLGVVNSEGFLALADVKAITSPNVMTRRSSMDSQQLLFHDAGAHIVRVGREPDGNGSVRVMGPSSTTGQQRGALLTPWAMESWEKESGARRTAIQTGDNLYIMFGEDYLRRRSNGGVDLATEKHLDGDLSSCLATIRGR